MPEPITDEIDSTWLNRIRISLMNKRDKFQQFDGENINKIVNALKNTRLKPTFKLPWELKDGVPKLRASETLFFSNEEKFDEFFILEKGFFTFFKHLEYHKFFIRTSFDCYSPYILSSLFNDTEFKLEMYVENWIKFSRMMLNSILEIITLAEINQNDYVKFNPERELESKGFELERNNFPFSALHYESTLSKGELYQIHNYLFNSPPTNFELIESINSYTDAEKLIKNYRFDEYFILDNCFFTFFKDLEYHKFYIRSSFDCYSPYILSSLFNDTEFKLEMYVENWIKFSRMMLNSILEIITLAKINQNDYVKFNPERELESKGFELERNKRI